MGLLDIFKNRRPGRRRHEPPRDTIPFPNLIKPNGIQTNRRLAYKPIPRNLRWFALNPYARRAINAIKNPIAMLEWEITPLDRDEKGNSELDRQIEIATFCFDHPNNDDSFRTLTEQVTEDILLGAGALETQLSGDEQRPLWMWPVDGLTIQIYPLWDGNPADPRYVQIVGYGNFVGNGMGQQVQLRNDELIYIRPNPSSATPFGHGPLEIAFNTVSRILGVGEFAGNVATNARPSVALDLGEGATEETLNAFRSYWRNEVEGQGTMPIWAMQSVGTDGKARGPEVLRMFPEGDKALYLEYQNFLIREIATAFDISPQVLGIEKDVNRNTAEVADDRDRAQAIKPYAHLVQEHLTREALHGKLGFSQLQFRFKGVEAEDELNIAQVYEHEYKNNALTPNDYRRARGWDASDNPFADMLFADVEIAIQAARGAAQVDDKNLGGGKSAKPKPKPKGKK
ncbi:phage portal protein [Bradyrhizobium sp. Tv2a-2]|uniref:phage portal protein n=1 Tax=Bradyrhizobium sp. Tv2a-2 TaxID=113395 RepID=UPI0004645F60|nr:phage portal protein [Bradyrhizobium sp. Tv2a-2]